MQKVFQTMFKPLGLALFAMMIIVNITVLQSMTARAQTPLLIAPGETVQDTITNETYEIQYQFSGQAGDVYVFVMHGGEIDAGRGLYQPALILQNPQNAVIASTFDQFQMFGAYGGAYLAVELPIDGLYTLVATREGGAAGGTSGAFTLSMIAPIRLQPGVPTSGAVQFGRDWDFYYYGGQDNFSVRYTRAGGDYWPEVAVHTSVNGNLTGVGYLLGDRMTRGQMGIFAGGDGYFITVGALTSIYQTNNLYQEGARANYQIEVIVDG